MAKFTMNIDADLKQQAADLYDELGMSLTTAVTVFLKQSVRERRMPFRPSFEDGTTATAAYSYYQHSRKPFDPQAAMAEVDRLRARFPKGTPLATMTPEDVKTELEARDA